MLFEKHGFFEVLLPCPYCAGPWKSILKKIDHGGFIPHGMDIGQKNLDPFPDFPEMRNIKCITNIIRILKLNYCVNLSFGEKI